MNIYIKQQQLKVGEVEITSVSSSSSFQVGDNDQVLLYSIVEDVPTSIQIGPFPQLRNDTMLNSTQQLDLKKKQLHGKHAIASALVQRVNSNE